MKTILIFTNSERFINYYGNKLHENDEELFFENYPSEKKELIEISVPECEGKIILVYDEISEDTLKTLSKVLVGDKVYILHHNNPKLKVLNQLKENCTIIHTVKKAHPEYPYTHIIELIPFITSGNSSNLKEVYKTFLTHLTPSQKIDQVIRCLERWCMDKPDKSELEKIIDSKDSIYSDISPIFNEMVKYNLEDDSYKLYFTKLRDKLLNWAKDKGENCI